MSPRRLVLLVLAALLAAPAAHAAGGKKPAPAPAPVPAAPAEPTPPAPDPQAWRATPPAAAADTGWQAPIPTRFNLSNGIPVWLLHRPGLPLVSIQLRMAAARRHNPPGKAGLAALTAAMLDEGTRTRTALGIAEEAESLGAVLSSGFGEEDAFVSLDALSETLDASLDLMADLVLAPAFDEKELERVRGDVLTELARRASEPRDVARVAFAAALYGPQHPYGALDIGTAGSVRALTRKDLLAFYKARWHAGNAAFVVAGDLDEARARALLEPRFGKWKAGRGKDTPLPAAANPQKVRLLFVEQPGAVQSVIRFGHLSIPRSAPDYVPTRTMLALLGGMFSSRINMNLREEHGWSYGAYAGLGDGREQGLFIGQTGVQADATAPAVREILKEIKEMQDAPPTAEELALARDSLKGDVAGVFETNSATAAFYASLPAFGLADDAWRGYLRQAAQVSADQVQQAARSHVDPGKLLIVVAGPAKAKVKGEDGTEREVDTVAELERLGLGSVERWKAE